jgi:arylsulfatase A-like enzyme
MSFLRTFCLLLSVASAGVSLVAEPSGRSASERPNLLFIYTDDQSHRTLSSYLEEGAPPWVKTPHIDRLAKEGVRFSLAYGSSWCVPSRAIALTGLQPHAIEGMDLTRSAVVPRNWATMRDGWDPEVVRMWPRELRKAGYETAMIGKWHLGQLAGHGLLWDHSVVWDQNEPEGDWYNEQKLSIDGAPARKIPGYATFVYTDYAEAFIRRERDAPWFLWLCYNAPHLPNTVHPEAKGTYAGVDVQIPEDWHGPRAGKPEYMRMLTMFEPDLEGKPRYGPRQFPLEEMIVGYNELVVSLDEAVGRLYAVLKETGQLDNTVIVFTSDQGFAWGERGYAWKVGPYDACLRMPLIVRYPSAAVAGSVVRQPVSILDLPPTLLGFAGLEVGWDLHGRDLRPVLADPAARLPGRMLVEHFGATFGSQITDPVTADEYRSRNVPWWLALVDGRYKYIRTLLRDEIEEVYDLEEDPEEQHNLALRPEHRQLLHRLRAETLAELRATGAHFVDSLAPIREETL